MESFLNTSTFIGLAQIILGIIMFLFPPKYGNSILGLSMKTTLKSEATWKKGQQLCAIALIVIGSLYTFSGIVIYSHILKFRSATLLISFICLWSLAKTMINKKLEKSNVL